MIVHAVEEFLQELETDNDVVERRIVCLTNLYQQSTLTPVIRHLFVTATYKATGKIVQFKQYVGDLWNAAHNQTPIEQSIALQQCIENACQQLGLAVRAGMYTERECCHSTKY